MAETEKGQEELIRAIGKDDSRRNFSAFMVHALFLALTMSFIDINTVVPAMISQSGGTAAHLGLLSAIMIGGTSFMQIVFAGLLLPYPRKKPFLITGIYLRVTALAVLGLLLLRFGEEGQPAAHPQDGSSMILMILGLMTVFSFSGSFANIAYMDIIGRAIDPSVRKRFFLLKQLIASIGLIASSLLVKVVLTFVRYPRSYSLLFMGAGAMLLAGTLGFWMVREPAAAPRRRIPFRERLDSFRKALLQDRNLRRYLLMINTSGIILSTIPFLMLFGRSRIDITGSLVGTYLMVQMGGGLAANLLINIFHRKGSRYKGMLYLFLGLGAAAPLLALVLAGSEQLYAVVFLVGGAATAVYQASVPGVLIEISNEENRPVYTGISGAGSIMNIIYPLTAGLLIRAIGFPAVLILSSLVIAGGLFAVRGIDCSNKLSV